MHKGKDERGMERQFTRLMKADVISLGGKPNFRLSEYGKSLDKKVPLTKRHKYDNCIDGIETYENSEFNMVAKEQMKRSRTYGL